jgi:hypothetical protein
MKSIKPEQDGVPEFIQLPDGRSYPTRQLLNQTSETYQNTRRTYNLKRINATNGRPRQVSSGRPNKSKYNREDAVWAHNQSTAAIAEKFGITRSQAYGIKYYLKQRYGNGSLKMVPGTKK